MTNYKMIDNYVLFGEISTDPIGKNFRAGEMENNEVKRHVLLTEVHPFLLKNPDTWNRINTLLQGIKKSNIPNLYSPEKIIKKEDKVYLVYNWIKSQTFEQILSDSIEKEVPINFDLAFSIAIAIADIVDIGSSIVVSGQKSFHGFLTPDNIIIDYEGKILLKNYGIYPYLERNQEIYSEMESKYGSWLTPEFLRKEKIVYQSDVYHLGYVVFRMLTGKYFSYTDGEDFDSKFSNLTFTHHIPSTEKNFLGNIIQFFKKSLNPDPTKRFSNTREAKDYISNFFRIDELSSVTFSLAYFINSLYMEQMTKENKALEKELEYTIPVEKPEEEEKKDDHLVESILTGLDEKREGRPKTILIVALVAILITIGSVIVFLTTSSSNKKKREADQANLQRQMELRIASMEQKYKEQLQELEQQTTSTEEEQKAKEEEINKLKEQQQKLLDDMKEKQRIEEEKLQKAEEERLQKEADEKKRKEEAAALKKKQEEEAARKLKEEEERKKREEAMKAKEGDLVALANVQKGPVLSKKVDMVASSFVRNKYRGRKFQLITRILIDEKGEVTSVKVLSKVPSDVKNVAEETLKKWRFKPAVKDGVNVKVWKTMGYNVNF